MNQNPKKEPRKKFDNIAFNYDDYFWFFVDEYAMCFYFSLVHNRVSFVLNAIKYYVRVRGKCHREYNEPPEWQENAVKTNNEFVAIPFAIPT